MMWKLKMIMFKFKRSMLLLFKFKRSHKYYTYMTYGGGSKEESLRES